MATSNRERARKMALLNPLPLHGTHFLQPPTRKAPVASSERRPMPGSQDSPLSEDELDAVYGNIASSPPLYPALSEISRSLFVSPASPTPRRLAGASRRARRIIESSTSNSSSSKVSRRIKKSNRKPTPRKNVRRLPVNELMLAPSAQSDVFHDPVSSYAGIEEHDPIVNSLQSEGHVSPSSDEQSKSRKAPLTAIRKRLQTPKFTHKSVIALRKKQQSRPTQLSKSERPNCNLGDGFDTLERKPLKRKLLTTTKGRTPRPLASFGALTIKAGPLPEVEFKTSSDFESDCNHRSEAAPPNLQSDAVFLPRSTGATSAVIKRRVSFSDRDMIMARLSSVSAPRRAYSISSDDESDGPNDDEDFLESETTPTSGQHATNEDDLVESKVASASNQETSQPDQVWRSTPPRAFVRSIGTRPSSNRQRLIEVEEKIEDHRPRSILRNRPLLTSENDTRPELTAANTRRNSRIATTEIDLGSHSRYFTSATRMLGDAPSKPRIIKQRTSDRHYSPYTFEKEVQVPDSDAYIAESSTMVRETSSPSRPPLHMLKRDTRAEWTSSIPNVPRDLRAITRRVSQDHGTLSQALRRRPSQRLFRSPMKVR